MKKEIACAMRSMAAVVVAFLALPGASYGQNARQQIEQKITETTRKIEAIKISNDYWKQIKPYLTNTLTKAQKAVDANHLFLALEYLETADTNLQGVEVVGQGETITKQGMPGYEAESARMDQYLTVHEQRYAAGEWNGKPLALRALAESDRVRTRAFFASGRGFAVATGPQEGLYYLGQAKGSIDFALFCQSLQLRSDFPAPPLHSLASEIRTLEDQILAVYRPPRSVNQHGQFIQIHSALKEAGDLESAKQYAGAFYKYLEAVGLFAALDAPMPGADKANDIRQRLSEARKRLTREKLDHSIAEILLQHAEEGLDPTQSKEAYAKGLQGAQVILDRVIPAYFQVLSKTEKLPAPPEHAITVTLVRWPYT